MYSRLTKSDILVLAWFKAYGGLPYSETVRVISEAKLASRRTVERTLSRLKKLNFIVLGDDRSYSFEPGCIFRLSTMVWPRRFKGLRDQKAWEIVSGNRGDGPRSESDDLCEAVSMALDQIADTRLPSSDHHLVSATNLVKSKNDGADQNDGKNRNDGAGQNDGKTGGTVKNDIENDGESTGNDGKDGDGLPSKPCRHVYRQTEKNGGKKTANEEGENSLISVISDVLTVTAKMDRNRRVNPLCIYRYIRDSINRLMASTAEEREKQIEALYPVFGLACEVLLSEKVLSAVWEELNKKLENPLGKNPVKNPPGKNLKDHPSGKNLETTPSGESDPPGQIDPPGDVRKDVQGDGGEGASGAKAPSPQNISPAEPPEGWAEVVIRGEKKRVPNLRGAFGDSPARQAFTPSRGGKMTPAQKAAITKTENKFAEDERLVAPRCHVRYQFMTPQERDYEYARTYVAVMERYGIDKKTLDSFKVWVESPAKFMSQKASYRNNYRRGRIEADRRGCRYEDILSAAFEEWRNKHSTYKFPGPEHLKGDVICTQIMNDYYGSVKGAVLTITREDISCGSPKKIALLPENFHDNPEDHPEEYTRQCEFYEDHVFQECERIARRVGGLASAVTMAIEARILPKQWAEGYGKHHHRNSIRSYRYAEQQSTGWTDDLKFG